MTKAKQLLLKGVAIQILVHSTHVSVTEIVYNCHTEITYRSIILLYHLQSAKS